MPELNVPLLRKVQEHILAEPNRLTMGSWIQWQKLPQQKVEDNCEENNCKSHTFPKCGTAACIAGWAVLLADPEREPREIHAEQIEYEAIRLLGLSDDYERVKDGEYKPSQSDRLFLVTDWPQKYAQDFFRARSPLAKAKAAAARIEHFIVTNGVD